MSPLISRQITGFNRRAYKPVIPVNSLYSHWDFSLLPDSVGTTYSSDLSPITNAFGLNIGSSAITPQLYHRVFTSGSTTVATINNRKCLSVNFTKTESQGTYLRSDGNAYPNISSSSVAYTWIGVYKFTPSGSYGKTYRWKLDLGYSNNHGEWQLGVGPSSYEIYGLNYANANRRANGTDDGSRYVNTIVHYEIFSLSGTTFAASYNNSSGGINTLVNVNDPFPNNQWEFLTYGTTSDSNRYLEIMPYTTSIGSAGSLFSCEFAFYNRYMTISEQNTVITNLKRKWG